MIKQEQLIKRNLFCRLVFLALALVVISACSGGGSTSSETGDTNTDGPASNLVTLAAMRNTSGVTKDFALAQFAAHFGELQTAPGYSSDGSMPIFATHAVAEVLQFIDEYSPAVQAEIYAKLFPPIVDNADTRQGSRNAQLRQVSRVYQVLANTIANRLEEKFGRTLVNGIEVVRLPTATLVSDGSQGEVSLFVVPRVNREVVVAEGILDMEQYGLQSTDSCWIVINEGTASLNQFDSYEPEVKLMALAHEVTHCFQLEMSTQQMPVWITEGTASWASVALAGQTDFYDWFWKVYENAEYNLFEGYGYEAIGFWSHVANSFESESRDLWTTLPAIFEGSSGDSPTDLALVLDQLGADGYAAWPTGRAMKPEFGLEWDSIGVGGRAAAVVPRATLETQTTKFGEVKNLVITPDMSDPNSGGPITGINVLPVLQITSDGLGAMHWSVSNDPIEFGAGGTLNFCIIGNCVCANGQPPTGYEDIQTWPENESLIIAMAGQANQLSSSIQQKYINPLTQCPTDPETTPIAGTGIDSCLVGRWTLDKAFLESQPGSDGAFNGDVFVNLNADGTGSTTFDLAIGAAGDTEEVETMINVVGDNTFNWGTSGSNYLVANKVSNTTISVSIIVDGVSSSVPAASNDTSGEAYAGPEEGQAAVYTCDENALVIAVEGEDAYTVRYVR